MSHRSWISRVGTQLLAVGLIVILTTANPSATGLPGSTLSRVSTAERTTSYRPAELPVTAVPDGRLQDVDCFSTSICVGVGSHGVYNKPDQPMAQVWNGTAWRLTVVPAIGGRGGSLESVSCTSETFCLAVGNADTAQGSRPFAARWDGSAWSRTAAPPTQGSSSGFYTVSCATDMWCVAGGFGTRAQLQLWDGGLWSIQTTPTINSSSVVAVSCAAIGHCMALATTPSNANLTPILHLDDRGWSRQQITNVNDLQGISCPATNVCIAVGGTKQPVAATWDGVTWRESDPPSEITVLVGDINCPSTTRCVVLGARNDSFVLSELSDGEWTTSQPAGLNKLTYFPAGFSCATVDYCMIVDSSPSWPDRKPLALLYDADSVESKPTDDFALEVGGDLNAVTCTSATFCMAAGVLNYDDVPYTQMWNGTRWEKVVPADAVRSDGFPIGEQPSLQGVSCSNPDFCAAVGHTPYGDPYAETWNGSRWISTKLKQTGRETEMGPISCISRTFCVAIGYVNYPNSGGGYGGAVYTFNGRTWAPKVVSKAYLNDIDCVSTTKCLIVGTSYATGTAKSIVMTWNGRTIRTVKSKVLSVRDAHFDGISCSSRTSCLVVGGTKTREHFVTLTGRRWHASPPPQSLRLKTWQDVACVRPGECTVIGQSGLITQSQGRWSRTSLPNRTGPGVRLTDVTCVAVNKCAVSGSDTSAPGGSFVLSQFAK